MRSFPNPSVVQPGPAEPGHVLPPEVPAAKELPRSAAMGRTLQRIRNAAIERRNLQREAERLLKMGRVMQRD